MKIKCSVLLGLLLAALAGHASDPWILDKSAAMPGSFWTITSPDGVWKLTCVPTAEEYGLQIDSGESTADLVIVNEYTYFEEGNWWSCVDVDVDDIYGEAFESCCVLQGCGILNLPSRAQYGGDVYTVALGDWSLEGWSATSANITKCVIPSDYYQYIGGGSSIDADFEVESGNEMYYSIDGVLYLNASYRYNQIDGDTGDELVQCPGGKQGSLTIPDVVTRVRCGAFERCSLSELVIGPNLVGFDVDHEVSTSLKKITINNNPRFRFENGLLLGDYGKTVLLTLHGVVSGTINVPSSVTSIPGYSMAYIQGQVDRIVATSPTLAVGYEAFEDSSVSVIDLSAVGALQLSNGAFEDVAPSEWCTKNASIYLPENTTFVDTYLSLDEDDQITDIYWPTGNSPFDSGLYNISTPHHINVHVLASAGGDWDEISWDNVTILKDIGTESGHYIVVYRNGDEYQSQLCETDKVYTLQPCMFTDSSGRAFKRWRRADGKLYDDGVMFFNLANADIVYLDAVWE